jgi:hypothetical protein
MMGAPQMPASPKMPDPVRIPSPDDPALMEARRKRMQEEFGAREGRASTQLSQDANSGAYSRTRLG